MRIASLASALFGLSLNAQYTPPLDSALQRWARSNAITVPPVDRAYADSDYAWLARVVGPARVIAVGENIHGAHEPLQFRNHVIRYAVEHLGVTAIALESAFTEGLAIEQWIQGGSGTIDSVMQNGLTSGFDKLPENRDLFVWLREYNRTATRKVHYYGMDQSGVNGAYDGRPGVEGALRALAEFDTASAQRIRALLTPLLDRFEVPRFATLSAAERRTLDEGLRELERVLARSTVPDARRRAVHAHLGWAARRVYDANAVSSGPLGARAVPTIQLRDSVMAENVRWMLSQAAPGERILVHAHNGHVMDVPMDFPAWTAPVVMTGHRLRAMYRRDLVVIGSAASVFDGLGDVPSDPSLWEVGLARLVTPSYAIDLRTADADAIVRARLLQPWLTRIHAWMQPIVPRVAADVWVTFDRVHRTTRLP